MDYYREPGTFGKMFLRQVNQVVWDASASEQSAISVAYQVAFGILMLLDGSGERYPDTFRVITKEGANVLFNHHDLTKGYNDKRAELERAIERFKSEIERIVG